MKKQACIIGGTSGIGKEIVRVLLSDGYQVFAIGRGKKHADELAVEVPNSNLEILFGDILDESFRDIMSQRIKNKSGKLDVLVNGAGLISGGGITVETFKVWQKVIDTNLNAPFLITKHLLDLLEQGESSSIINISSVCSIRTCSSLSYSVSKAGLDMFTKVLAKELAPKGIRVNAVNPSVVRSNLQMSSGLFDTEDEYNEWIKKMVAFHPLGRIGNPMDIAAAVKFLVSKDASWITGAILSVDGGRSIL